MSRHFSLVHFGGPFNQANESSEKPLGIWTKTIQVKMQHNKISEYPLWNKFPFFLSRISNTRNHSLKHTLCTLPDGTALFVFFFCCLRFSVYVLASDKRLIFFMLTSSSHYHRSVLMQQFRIVCVCNTRAAIEQSENSFLTRTNRIESNCYCMCFYSLFFFFYFTLFPALYCPHSLSRSFYFWLMMMMMIFCIRC